MVISFFLFFVCQERDACGGFNKVYGYVVSRDLQRDENMKRFMVRVVIPLVIFGGLFGADSVQAAIFVSNTPYGVQSWSGPLGDDFTVGAQDIIVTKLGVFDDGANGLNRTITAYIYNFGGATPIPIGPIEFTTDNSSLDPVIPYRFRTLDSPVTLTAGASYSIVAENYGPTERNHNTNEGSPAPVFSSSGLTVGGGRYSSTQGSYPHITGTWHFGVANFEYSPIPEPCAFLIWSLLGALGIAVGWYRRRKAA